MMNIRVRKKVPLLDRILDITFHSTKQISLEGIYRARKDTYRNSHLSTLPDEVEFAYELLRRYGNIEKSMECMTKTVNVLYLLASDNKEYEAYSILYEYASKTRQMYEESESNIIVKRLENLRNGLIVLKDSEEEIDIKTLKEILYKT